MLNLAIIGCGVISHYHLSAIAKLKTARAVAVCDLRADLAQQVATQFGVPRWTCTPAELLGDPAIDGVILAVPACVRTALTVEAFRRGKHVLTEKPVAMNAAEVLKMLAVQGTCVVACCSSRFRHFASARAACAFVRGGALGPIRVISCRGISVPGPAPAGPAPGWRLRRDLNGGGIFVNWGSYDLDYLFSMFDFKLTPQLVLARTWKVGADFAGYAAPGSDGETHAAAFVTFAEGCVLNYERAEFSTIPADSRWQIVGETGSLTMQMMKAGRANIVVTEPDAANGVRSRVVWEGDESAETSEHDGPVADFVGAMRGEHAPATSLRDALLFARVADAVYASAESGQPVFVG